MLLFAAAAQAYPLQPEPVEGGPSYTTQPTNAVLQRLQQSLARDPQADALLRSVVADVSAQPGAAAGVAKLLALMDAGGESQQAVMGSLQELLDGKTEGPGLRALATQLGMQPDGLAHAAKVQISMAQFCGAIQHRAIRRRNSLRRHRAHRLS